MVEYLKIPEERLAVLLGEKGSVKGQIEQQTNTKIEVDESLCEVTISQAEGSDDPLCAWTARDIVKAIGRGFEPEIAMLLADEENEFRLIDLKEYVGKSKNALIRIRGRIIGREGKAKNIIEDYTDTHIVIYGKTVAIIGRSDKVDAAAKAVEMLASGSRHGSVYKMLESGKWQK